MSSKSNYFPLFLDISNKKIVFLGAGDIACRRLEKLIEYNCDITVIAPKCSENVSSWSDDGIIRYFKRKYCEKDLINTDIVFACTDSKEINHEIYLACKAYSSHILVNNCSDKEECDFYFPGIISDGDTVIAITSNGDHSKTKELRERIENNL